MTPDHGPRTTPTGSLFASRRWVVWGARKVYVRIPYGEVQYGRISHRLTVWFRGRRLV